MRKSACLRLCLVLVLLVTQSSYGEIGDPKSLDRYSAEKWKEFGEQRTAARKRIAELDAKARGGTITDAETSELDEIRHQEEFAKKLQERVYKEVAEEQQADPNAVMLKTRTANADLIAGSRANAEAAKQEQARR